MRGIFIASGPAFAQGKTVDWIKLVDEYQIFLEVGTHVNSDLVHQGCNKTH